MTPNPRTGVPGAGLDFSHVPPLSVPLRYFLTAPLFGMGAALGLLATSFPVLSARALPVTLALTHVVTLGVLTMIAIGALWQVLPVLGAVVIARLRLIATVVHLLLCAGTVMLAVGLAGMPRLIPLAVATTVLALLIFFLTAFGACLRAATRSASISTLRFALAGLLLAIAAGAGAALLRAGIPIPGVPAGIGQAHIALALGGWFGLLLAGTAYSVVPMFQMTPSYPAWLSWTLAPLVFALLLLLTASQFAVLPWPVGTWIEFVLESILLGFALQTLVLLRKRRRRTRDATTGYWLFGMGCAAAALTGLIGLRLTGTPASGAAAVALGLLLLIGALQAVMTGMLYKIVPFLLWLHLQRQGIRGGHMADFLPQPVAALQFRLHVATTLLLVTACGFPKLAPFAALGYLVTNLVLAHLIVDALRRYRRRLRDGVRHPLHDAKTLTGTSVAQPRPRADCALQTDQRP